MLQQAIKVESIRNVGQRLRKEIRRFWKTICRLVGWITSLQWLKAHICTMVKTNSLKKSMLSWAANRLSPLIVTYLFVPPMHGFICAFLSKLVVWLPGGQKRSRFCSFPSLSLAGWSERWAVLCFFALRRHFRWMPWKAGATIKDIRERTGRCSCIQIIQLHFWLRFAVKFFRCQVLSPKSECTCCRRSDRCSRPDWRPGPGRQREILQLSEFKFVPIFQGTFQVSGKVLIQGWTSQLLPIAHASCEFSRFSWAGHLKPVRMPRQVLLLSQIPMLQKC